MAKHKERVIREGRTWWVEVEPGHWIDVDSLSVDAVTLRLYLDGVPIRDIERLNVRRSPPLHGEPRKET